MGHHIPGTDNKDEDVRTGSHVLCMEPVGIGVVPPCSVEPLIGVDGEYDGTNQNVRKEQSVEDSEFGQGPGGQGELSLVENGEETVGELAELVAVDGHGVHNAGADCGVDQREGVVGEVHLIHQFVDAVAQVEVDEGDGKNAETAKRISPKGGSLDSRNRDAMETEDEIYQDVRDSCVNGTTFGFHFHLLVEPENGKKPNQEVFNNI